MICSNCNSEVADNSIMCPICGGPVARRPVYSGDAFGNNNYGMDSNYNDQLPSYMDLKPTGKKSNPTAIVIAFLLMVFVVAGGMFFYKNILNKDKSSYDGKYKFEAVYVNGMTVDSELFATAGYDTSNMYLEIKGETIKFTGWETFGLPMYGEATIKIAKDGQVTLKGNGQTLTGDIKNGKLTIYANGGEMTFVKE